MRKLKINDQSFLTEICIRSIWGAFSKCKSFALDLDLPTLSWYQGRYMLKIYLDDFCCKVPVNNVINNGKKV